MEKIIQCFFDPVHLINQSKYPYHVQKCRKEHPNVKHKVCPYNALHIMVPKDYNDHIRKCDSRPLSALIAPDDVCQPAMEGATNTWEEGAWGEEQEPVVPQNVQKDNIFIYTPLIGGSKSQRKQHRISGRREYSKIENARQQAQSKDDEKKKKKKKKSRNSKSNSENVNNAPGNNPIPNNVGNEPLAEQNCTAPDGLNLRELSIKD